MKEQVVQRKALSLPVAGLVALVLGVLALLTMAPPAQAEERVCRGTIGAATVDNLRVPQSATCTLNGTRVEGTVKVERGARLYATSIRVKGNVQSEGFKNILLRGNSVVVGSVQLKNGLRGGTGIIKYTRINGDLQFETNAARMSAASSTILSNFQVVQNTGGVAISKNRISENLQCKQNVPAPTGGGNVAGDKEGQCARL